MKKRIAILTWIHYENYGSILQAYALKTYLEKQGLDVYFIDYFPNSKFPKPLIVRLGDFETVKKKAREMIFDRRKLINGDLTNRHSLFQKFIEKHLNLTVRCETNSQLEHLNDDYDFFICGSDQIWSPLVFDEKFYLSFVNDKRKMIAYAPSIGTTAVKDPNVAAMMKKNILRFDKLSVREIDGQNIIKNLTGKNAELVADPTLLLSKNDWIDCAEECSVAKDKKYLLVYLLGNHAYYYKYIKAVAEIYNLEVIVIPFNNHDYDQKHTVAYNLTPTQFVYLFKNAYGVCTDSFHGTVFSLIFNKPFLTFKRFSDADSENQNSRVFSLLSTASEKHRFVGCFSKKHLKLLSIIPSCTTELKDLVNNSKDFISECLFKEVFDRKEASYKITANCSGCGVCAISCPVNAIELAKNENGFFESKINKKKCLKCNLCKKICGFNSELVSFEENQLVYAIRNKNHASLTKSSSGGIATVLAEKMSQNGCTVVGCEYNYEKNIAELVAVEPATTNIDRFAGSKYLQSYTLNAYKRILDFKKGLIFGLPCQIASLHNFLLIKGRRDDYILVDLICHGVPSYNLWDKYVEHIKDNYHFIDGFEKIIFRAKNNMNSNNNMNMQFIKDDYSVILHQKKDLFYHFFCLGIAYNMSCYNCNFRNSSKADLRIGDYWGEKYKNIPGTSMTMPLTSKGIRVLEDISPFINKEAGSYNDYITNQQINNINPPDNYEELMRDLQNTQVTMKQLEKKYCEKYYCLDGIKKIIKTMIRR